MIRPFYYVVKTSLISILLTATVQKALLRQGVLLAENSATSLKNETHVI